MDIAALSMALSQMNAATQISTAVTDLAMDTAANQATQFITDMTKSMEMSVQPHMGTKIDMVL